MATDQENSLYTQIQYKLVEELTKTNQTLKKEIEERINIEKQLTDLNLELEEALQVKSDFLSTMSHEIRTPLNIIIGYIQLLNLKIDLNEYQKEFSAIQIASNDLLKIVNQILRYSKLESQKPELNKSPFSSEKLMQHFYSLFEQRANIKQLEFKVKHDQTIPNTLIGDKGKLNQILFNLLGNAFKFTEKGTINFSSKLESIKGQTAIVKFIVKDTGIGIPNSHKKIVFEKFKQVQRDINREFGGTGLGLSISKNLTEIMGGSISLKSSERKGTEFTLRLPFKYSHSSTNNSTDSTFEFKAKSLLGVKILLVDDYIFNQVLASKILNQMGCKVVVANNGLEALEQLKNKEFNLILMDVHMPKLNGYETTKIIRDKNRKTPILGFTADVMDNTKKKIFESGMNDIITKPFVLEELIKKVMKYI